MYRQVKPSPSLLPSILPLCELCNPDMKELSRCFPHKDPPCACSVPFFFLIHLIHPPSNPSIHLSINTIMNFQQIQHLLILLFLAQRSQKDSAKNTEEHQAVAALLKSKSILNLCESPAYKCAPWQLSCSWLLIPDGLVSGYMRIHSHVSPKS